MESLLSLILVILIVLVMLVVFIPAWLERLSRRNRTLRRQYAAELRDLERDARRLDRTLMPYTRLRSAAYSAGAAEAGERLHSATTRLGDLAELLSGLRVPQVFDYLFPAQHFAVTPGDAGAILADSRKLRRARTEMAGAVAALSEARTAVGALAALPERLAAERTALARRLSNVESAIHRERDAGIEKLNDLVEEATAARRLLGEWRRAATPEATLDALDAGATALESAAAALAGVEGRVAETTRERTALDERLRGATAELDDAQKSAKAGPGAAEAPPRVRPLLLRAAALLNETAPAHRRRRDFAAAGSAVDEAAALIAFGRDLTAAEQQARALEARDDGVSLAGAIAGLRREVAELFDQVGDEAGDARPDATALAGRAAQTRARAETLTRQQDEIIAGLERDAAATRERLERAWDAGQRLLRLADDDPLSRRHAHLLEAYAAAQRRPADLEQFNRDVAAFEGNLAPWITRVQATRARIVRLRERLPLLIDDAQATAAPWNCLAESVDGIRQRTADFQTAQAQFAVARYRREAEALMEQIEAIEHDVEERHHEISGWAARLAELEAGILEIASLTLEEGEGEATAADGPQRARKLAAVDKYRQQARAATRCEDAALTLQRAGDVVNRMI